MKIVEWNRLEDLAATRFREVPIDSSGVYFVRWSKNGAAVPIQRLSGVDDKGILYIGSAKKLKRRVRELWNGINGKVEQHTIGKTIIFCKISEIMKLNEYDIAWEELKPHKSAIGQEWAAFKSYAERYKEPPPLNLSIRRGFFAVLGLAEIGKSRLAYPPDEFVRYLTGAK
jgi:predicted GIY-YIG superfamily endonuclease